MNVLASDGVTLFDLDGEPGETHFARVLDDETRLDSRRDFTLSRAVEATAEVPDVGT